ncbi:hypothetical protein [Pseudomonas aeruginosa]|uniref:hypothetical protein n=1 Tax=Pseudomonas aeruginosa TaxID=287 RepID=UPI00215A0614|nr:hypothetical protein [Pseudomonas aeruginosa]
MLGAQLALQDRFEQLRLAGELRVERPGGKTSRLHQGVQAGAGEALALHQRSGLAQQQGAGGLFLFRFVAHADYPLVGETMSSHWIMIVI